MRDPWPRSEHISLLSCLLFGKPLSRYGPRGLVVLVGEEKRKARKRQATNGTRTSVIGREPAGTASNQGSGVLSFGGGGVVPLHVSIALVYIK